MTVDSLAFSSIGSTIAVTATAPATLDAAGFGALTYTSIGEVTEIGTFGASAAKVTHIPLSTGVTIKRKGAIDAGTIACKMARAPTDAGQAILVAAEASNSTYSFCVTLQSGTKLYFLALVMSYQTNVGNAGQITGADVNIDLTTIPVAV